MRQTQSKRCVFVFFPITNLRPHSAFELLTFPRHKQRRISHLRIKLRATPHLKPILVRRSVDSSVRRSISHIRQFSRILRRRPCQSVWMANLHHCPSPRARDFGCRVSGLVFRLFYQLRVHIPISFLTQESASVGNLCRSPCSYFVSGTHLMATTVLTQLKHSPFLGV